MGISSARPDKLEDFAKISRNLDDTLTTSLRRLINDYRTFLGANRWGVFEADSLIGAYSRYLNGNDFSAKWVAGIAAAFRAAGGDGCIVRLPDSAIKASLKAAGLDHGRHHVNFRKPKAYGFPPTTGYTDDPVNTATGNFVEVESDLACGGLVAGLSFDRTYNSRSDRVGPFGRGWSSWATVKLVPGPEGAAYVGPDGQEAVFPRMGDGYGRVIGVDALVEPLESGLALRWFGGAGRWVFDEAGRPVSLSRGPGTEVRLRHDSAGRLVELSHGGGKQVRLQWDEDSARIVALACSDGRGATYRYDDANNLVEAEGVLGTRRYELDETGRVVSVIDADGVVELVNTYDDEGRVAVQLSPFGRRTQMFYLPGGVTVTMDDDDDHPANTFVHDEEGRLTAVIDGDEQQLSTSYDDWGNPTAVTERNGVVTTQEYDERNRPVRRALPTGATVAFAYDDADRLVEVALSEGAVTRYSFDGDERSPSEIVDPEGGVTRQTVRDGLVHRIVDPDGVTIDFEHDADGNIVAATDGEGNTAQLERDDAGRVIALVSPLGRRTAYFYDPKGLLVERQDPLGAAWRYEYTAAGRLASVVDPTGAREEIRYGEHGNAAATVDALGHATAHDYDVFGNLVGVVEPDGTSWKYGYDALMRWTHTVDAAGGTWQQEYDVNGTLVGTVDPVGTRMTASVDVFGRVVGIGDGLSSSSFDLDELGRIVSHRLPDGTQSRSEYDLCGRRTLMEDACGAILRVEYTPGGRVARQVSPTGRVEALEYDVQGRVAAHIDGAGRRSQYRYDADGNITEIELPTGEIERFEYDECGRQTSSASPGAGVTTHVYDLAGRVVATTDREAGQRRFEHDAAGQLVEATDAHGEVTRYAYNERGWLTQITDPLGGTVTRHYDAVGRMIEQIDQLGRSTTFAFDAAGRLIEQVDATGRRTCHTYDVAGRIVSCGPADDEPITIEYDAAGRAIAIDEPGAISNRLRWDAEDRLVERSRGDLAMRWKYDADGERSAIGYPDGTETTYARDAGGYVIAAQHPALGTIALERDAAGRLTGASADGMRALWRYASGDLVEYEMHAGDRHRTAQLTRDPLGRIAEATIDGQAHRFAYDRAGQLLSAQTPAGVLEFSYDANGRLAREVSPAGAVDYEYDAAGQLLTRADPDGVIRYEYDAAGRRVGETGPELDRSYAWDKLGRLTEVTRSDADGGDLQAIDVVVDALGELAALDGTPMLWDTAHPLSPLTWRGQDAVVGEGASWALAGGGAGQWLAPDWQGTIGDVTRDPWGAAQGMAPVAPGPQLGYRGEVEFSGEHWLRNRIYQPETRSFPQPDPFPPQPGTPSAANPYHYAANNPISRADPLGLHPVSEKELNGIRDRMNPSLLQQAVKAYKTYSPVALVVKYSSEISAVTGLLALIPTPLSPVLAGISIATGGIATAKAVYKGDWTTAAIDAAAIIPGVAGLRLALKSKNVAAAAKADKIPGWRGESVRGQMAQREKMKQDLQNAQHKAHEIHIKGLPYDAAAAGIATGGVIRTKFFVDEEKKEAKPSCRALSRQRPVLTSLRP